MAMRNRSTLFRKYREALKSVRAPTSMSSALSGGGGGAVIEMVNASFLGSDRSSYAPLSTEDPTTSRDAFTIGLPPAWVDESEEITDNIRRIRGKITELTKAHAKALLPSFEDSRDNEKKIEFLMLEVTELLRRSEKKLQKLSVNEPAEESSIRKNVQRSLATDLQQLSMDLRKKQSLYLKCMQQQNERQDDIDLEMKLNDHRMGQQDDDSDLDFSENQLAKMKRSKLLTEERESEIRQVVKSFHELAQIMKDVSVLVIDQGTIVDRIDYNIQNVSSSVEKGLKQLEKAERSQKNGGMVKCATVLLIMCVVMLVLLVLKEILF